LSGWDPEAALLDPFCGSGTILIEAAWIALGVPPGITRPFGFERLRDHDAHRWEDLKDEARSRILPELATPLIGIDANPEAIEAARRNAERAYLTEDTIQFELGDARDAAAPAASASTSPPQPSASVATEKRSALASGTPGTETSLADDDLAA
jgi:putative N6-adenine-specific DNA methylase